MNKKEIIVETLTEMVRALEFLDADVVIIKGMINCGRYKLCLHREQELKGFDEHSGLQFRYEEAQSAILLEERSKLASLKLEVTAERYPSKERMQAVVEANGYQSTLQDVWMDINVKAMKAEEYKQYSGIYPRHEVLLSGKIFIRSRGHYVAPIADCPLATSRLVGRNVSLILEGGRLVDMCPFRISGDNNLIQIKTKS